MREYRDERVLHLERINAALLEALEAIILDPHITETRLRAARAAIRTAKREMA